MRTSTLISFLSACVLLVLGGCSPVPTRPDMTLHFADAEIERTCFAPLSDTKSRNPKDWKDMVDRSREKHVLGAGVEKFLSLDDPDNVGDYINLDFYEVSFKQPTDMTVKELFAEMRTKFPDFVKGKTADFTLQPFGEKGSEIYKTNNELWSKAAFMNAVMSFKLHSLYATENEGAFFRLTSNYGEVQAICTSPTDFIFATVKTEPNQHPVAGVRGFGLKDNRDGTWSFYSKASDRLSNWLGNKFLRSRSFKKGDEFWDVFYANMLTYLNGKGLVAREKDVVKNRNSPDAWPGDYFKKP